MRVWYAKRNRRTDPLFQGRYKRSRLKTMNTIGIGRDATEASIRRLRIAGL